MSNFQKQQAKIGVQQELAQLELSLRDQQFKMEMKNKCIQYAIQTARPTVSKIDTTDTPAGTEIPPADKQIIESAGRYYAFLNRDNA